MGLTLINQLDDILNSDVYDDTILPSLANYETNPFRTEGDFNSIRSQLNNLLNRNGAVFPIANWYDDCVAPATFELGSARGVNTLNADLHGVERKRVLREVQNLVDIAVGAGNNFVVLGAGQLPANTTAAVGLVTTLGSVAAAHAGVFGTHDLSLVAGPNALKPRNFVHIVNAATHDPILSGGFEVGALLHTESATDGHTMSTTAGTQVQLSFVRLNPATVALEAVPAIDIAGMVVHFRSHERIAFSDLTEVDWLRGGIVDVAAGTTVDLTNAYSNQGATVVSQITSTTHDLAGAGLTETWRDALGANLVSIIEGSAAGTSEFQVASGVDVFTSNAAANTYLTGATFGTSGTGIQVAEVAGVISRAGNLTVQASGAASSLLFDDGYFTAEGTWTGAGIPLASSAAEVAALVANFGDGTSIASMLTSAVQAGHSAPTWAVVGAAHVAANTDLGGPGTAAANLLQNLPDALSVGTFTSNHILWVNGRLLRPGANAAANFDYYPGTNFTPGNVEIMFEQRIRKDSTIAIVAL